MKIETKDIARISELFAKMQTKEDLLFVLNEANKIIYGENAFAFELKHLTYLINTKNSKSFYKRFTILKKSGAERQIHAPVKLLKNIQRTMSFVLQCVFNPHQAAYGFVRNKSIVDNAKLHLGNRYVYNIDLKDFFESVDQARVWRCLQLPPFNLNEKTTNAVKVLRSDQFLSAYFNNGDKPVRQKAGAISYVRTNDGTFYDAHNIPEAKEHIEAAKLKLPPFNLGKKLKLELWYVNRKPGVTKLNIANMIASICCAKLAVERLDEDGIWQKVERNVLPQGAPTSPVITNIVCQRLDFLLSGVAKRFGLKYSRYADDITFSSMHNVYQPGGEFLTELHRIIAAQGFHIKESKTRLQKDGYRKEVTGLLVNENVNVQQRYIKQLRMWLYYWERYGYQRASGFFLQQYNAEKGHVKYGKPDMANVISGKLDYLKMVKGEDNELYLKLKRRFDKHINTNIKTKTISESEIISLNGTNQVRITMEVYQSPEMNEKLYSSINIPKDTVLPSTIIVPNLIEEIKEGQDPNLPNKLFPHNPMYTISFLKKFKIGDGSGFKELVHDVILSDETMQDILNKVKCHPNFISHYKGEKVVNVSYINRGIVMSVRELINLFESEGLPYYKNSHKHPFNNDSEYTKFAKEFKRKYRYGSGSEYSKLQDDIVNIFNEQQVSATSLSFLPDDRKFDIRSSFFTWQPSIYNGLRYIIQGISDHSNINGERAFSPNEKKILIKVERIKIDNLNFVELTLFDCHSVSKNDSETLLHYFKGSFPYQYDFRNLCDWVVECDFLDESSKRLNLLVAPEYASNNMEIEELNNSVGGFKHILRFYDVR